MPTITIRRIEEISLNALPTLETLYYDGWMLRLAGGYPRRANSVQLLYPSVLPLEEKIAYCEAQYAARGLRTMFKFTDAAPRDLAALLTARGYVVDSATLVRTVDLSAANLQPAPADVLIEPRMSDSWLDDYTRMNNVAPPRVATLRSILAAIPCQSAFLRIRHGGATVALGLGVLDQGWLGLYDIVTDSRARRQGFGRAVVLSLLQWGKARGAVGAYLQVIADNAPAQALYDGIGFREAYRYWYLQNNP